MYTLNIYRSRRWAYIYLCYFIFLTHFLSLLSYTGVPGAVRPRHTRLVKGSRLAATASGLPKRRRFIDIVSQAGQEVAEQ